MRGRDAVLEAVMRSDADADIGGPTEVESVERNVGWWLKFRLVRQESGLVEG